MKPIQNVPQSQIKITTEVFVYINTETFMETRWKAAGEK